MRAAMLLLTLAFLPLVPTTTALDIEECTPTLPGGTHACVVEWDEPDVICAEVQVGATYRERCVRDPRGLP